MPIYKYTAKRGPGEVVTGEVEAPSQDQALLKLEKMKLVPVKIGEALAAKDNRKRSESLADKAGELPTVRKKISPAVKVKASDLDTFTRQLASLVKSGIMMLQSLAILAQQTESKALKEVVADLAGKIKDGKMLSEAMTAYPRIFNGMYLNMIKAGERSGTLDQVLFRLAQHREREQELRQKVTAALAYPVLVIIVGAGTIFIMLTYFLPKLTSVFKGMKQELPLPTKILMGITGFMSGHWYIFPLAALLLFAVFVRMRKANKTKILLDMIMLRIPFLQKFTRNAQIARFARSLAMLQKNGLPIHESLELAADTLDNEALKGSVREAARTVVEQGLSLSESFTRTKIFPDFTLNMVMVGEKSGRLVESLEEIADVYEREVEQSIKIMSSLMEPILILVVGAIVGFIVFAMLLPVFNIGVMTR